MDKLHFRRTTAGFLIAYLLVIVSMLLGLPVPLAVMIIALASFGFAGYYHWLTAKPKTGGTAQTSIFVFFGCLSLLLALVAWVTHVPPPGLMMSVGLLAGGLIGSAIIWLMQPKLGN